MTSAITADEFREHIKATIPLTEVMPIEVRHIEEGRAELVLLSSESHVREGGTVSGPALMTLIDAALYAAVLSIVGKEPNAVTSDLSIRFLKRPEPGALRAVATILKRGRSMVGQIEVSSERDGQMVAHATGTYSVPRTPSNLP